MAKITIKTNKRRMNLFEQGETDVYVTSPVTYSKITADDLLEAAARNSGINDATIYAGMRAVVNEFENFLMNGHSVQVPLLGTYRLSLRSKAVATEAEAGANAIYRRGIIYTPTTRLKAKLNSINLNALPADILTTADDEAEETNEP